MRCLGWAGMNATRGGDVGVPVKIIGDAPGGKGVPAVSLSANRLQGNVALQFVESISIIT
jgi:hypothetical protein